MTLADRLRPLVDAAVAGKLSPGQHAELERLLIGYWRRRLELEQAAAGPVHRPCCGITTRPARSCAGSKTGCTGPAGTAEPVDVAALLKPYQAIPADQPEEDETETATSEPAVITRSERHA